VLANRKGIISAGTWALDRIKLVDAWPQEEHLAQIIGTDQQGGGSGYNLAVDITQLDASMPVYGIGLLGADSAGDFLRSKAKSYGIHTQQLHTTHRKPTSYTDVISDSRTGRRTFFHYPGTSELLSPEHFDFQCCAGKILHLGLLGLHQTMDHPWRHYDNGWVAVLDAARQQGIHTNLELVSIDSDRIREIAGPCLPYLDSLIINEYELSALAGLPVHADTGEVSRELCLVAMKSVLAMSPMKFIVVHFPAAAIALTADHQIYQKSSFAVHPSWIASAVGAGDAFAAGMLYGVHEAWDFDTSLTLAHAAAAASLRAQTTVDSVDSVSDCLAFAKIAGDEMTDASLLANKTTS